MRGFLTFLWLCPGVWRDAKMVALETQWGELVSKNMEIELACQRLEAELGAEPPATA